MTPPMYVKITTDITEAKRIITEGRVVAFPTGTAYGLAVDALQGHALQRVRNLKMRPAEKTFTVFMKSDLVSKYFTLSKEERGFVDTHTGKPITLLLTPTEELSHLAQDGRVGLRFIDHPLMQKLADTVDVPLTATSANRSGNPACYDTTCITKEFPGKLPDDIVKTMEPEDIAGAHDTTYDLSLGCIVDSGNLPVGNISTIIRLEGNTPKVIRQGAFQV